MKEPRQVKPSRTLGLEAKMKVLEVEVELMFQTQEDQFAVCRFFYIKSAKMQI